MRENEKRDDKADNEGCDRRDEVAAIEALDFVVAELAQPREEGASHHPSQNPKEFNQEFSHRLSKPSGGFGQLFSVF